VWAPHAGRVAALVNGDVLRLEAAGEGVFEGRTAAAAGDDYHLVVDGGVSLPDPCSRWQPEGVLGPSRVVDPGAFAWSDGGWGGLDPRELVLYELHVGTFTRAGTFAAAIERLAELRELGVTAIELMPVATFPGARNWGYDGLYTWAPHPAYGGPEGLVALIDAAHAAGLGVIVDVVYNHIGPGSQALEVFGPYLTHDYATPWGTAVNFDGRDSGGVREWAIQNAEMWVRDYHVDGLRVDAVHAIHDHGARHVMAELCDRAHAAAGPRRPVMIAESDLNDPRVVTATPEGGWGFDAQWADDFHHALHARLTGEADGYYGDFGAVADLAAATERPFVYDGRYSAFRRRRHGASARELAPERFVVYSQNHDQVGNRALGDRLPSGARALAAMWVLLSPFTPMLFMGEEYGEERPFQFFTDHIDPFIADATRAGRRNEFKEFAGFEDEVPDPQDAETFARSVLDPAAGDPALRALYRDLLALRARLPRAHAAVRFDEAGGWISMARGDVEVVGNFGTQEAQVQVEATRLVLATGGGVVLAGDRLTLPPRAGAVVA
jgi:maltooligosyltrehalose trehalohydrolase